MNFDFLTGFSMASINTQKKVSFIHISLTIQVYKLLVPLTQSQTETAWLQTPTLLMGHRTADIGPRAGSSLGVKWLLTNTTHKLASEEPQEHCPSQELPHVEAC